MTAHALTGADAFGPKWGAHFYSAAFTIVLVALVGGVVVGGIHGYRDMAQMFWPPISQAPKYPLTEYSRDQLRRVLEHAPPAGRFRVVVYWPQLSGGVRYAQEVANTFKDAKWEADVSGAGLTFSHGFAFMLPEQDYNNQDKWPDEARRLMRFLDESKIDFTVSPHRSLTVPYAFIVGPPE